MNLVLGGGWGFKNEEHRKKFLAAGGRKVLKMLNKKHFDRIKWDKEYKEKWCNSLSKSLSGENSGFYNKKHSEKTKNKIGLANSISQKGIKNSQYGTCWITNEKENKKINKNDKIPNGWILGRKIKI